jgi:hypothetical protein
MSAPTWVPSKHGRLEYRFCVTIGSCRMAKRVPALTWMQEGRVGMWTSLHHIWAGTPMVSCAIRNRLEWCTVIGRTVHIIVGIVMRITACKRRRVSTVMGKKPVKALCRQKQNWHTNVKQTSNYPHNNKQAWNKTLARKYDLKQLLSAGFIPEDLNTKITN